MFRQWAVKRDQGSGVRGQGSDSFDQPSSLIPHLSFLIFLLLAGCGSTLSPERPAEGRCPVLVGIPPLAYLVEQIGGEHVKVDALVQPGQDPHTFEPTPRQVLALSRAVIFFQTDMPFENALLEKIRAGNRRLEIIDATRGIEKRAMDAPYIERTDDEDYDHPMQGGEPDPHVWLAPRLLKIQAQNVAAALCRVDPAHRRDYQRNLAALCEHLDAVDRRIGRMLAPYRGRSFYVFHPGFGYFADAYGLKEEAIQAGGRPPTAKQLRTLIEKAKAEGVKVIFVQSQFDPRGAQVIAQAIGGKVVPIDGLGKDVIADIEDIAEKIEQSFRLTPASTPGLEPRERGR